MPHSLSATQVATITKPGVFRVDHGLYLQVRDNGKRSWLLRFQLNGRSRAMGLGPLRLIPLTEARSRSLRAQRLLLDGIDPIEVRKADKKKAGPGIPTFAFCAESYIEAHEGGWKSGKSAVQWRNSIATYVNPTIGALPVDKVTVDHMVEILRPIWSEKSETAGRVRARVESILDWARAKNFRDGTNPATWKGSLSHLLPKLSRVQVVEHYAAVAHADVPKLMTAVQARKGNSSAALQLAILTAARSGEVRGARWDEVDLKKKTWTVPAARMKGGRDHRVPLSAAAVRLLKTMPQTEDLIFPSSKRGVPLSDMALISIVRKIQGMGATVHGFRSSFRDWAAESTTHSREAIELSLAHAVGTKVEAAYFRSDLFAQRAKLMADWADFVSGLTHG